MEKYIDGSGQELTVHDKARCSGACCIHGPSDHHMKDWPTNWRQDRKLIERVCPHGIGHPDPDDVAFRAKNPNYPQTVGGTQHGCDGCCIPPKATGRAAVPKMAHMVAKAKAEHG